MKSKEMATVNQESKSLKTLAIFVFEKEEEDEMDQKMVMFIFPLVPSPCFHFLKKEGGNERDKEGDFILFSPRFPLPPSLKGKKRKIK